MPRVACITRFACFNNLMCLEAAVFEILNSFASSEIDRVGLLTSRCSIRRFVLLPNAVKSRSASRLSSFMESTACRTYF